MVNTQKVVLAVFAAAAAVGIVLWGPWWDIGQEYGAAILCSRFVDDETTMVTAVRDLVPARLGCSIDGQVLATRGAGGAQVLLALYAVALATAAVLKARLAAAVTVTGLFVVGGLLLMGESEGSVTVTGAVVLAPMLALFVGLFADRRPTLRTFTVLTLATWFGYGAGWMIWATGVTIAVAVPVSAAVACGLDTLGRRVTQPPPGSL